MKVAIVGCGKIADAHVEQILKLARSVRIVAACDLEPLMAEQLARRYAIAKTYVRFEELLERERPDVVHITTPPGPHLALAELAFSAGAHVFVEKPAALSLADTERMLEAAQRAERLLTVGHTYLYDPPAVRLRELIADGTLGELVHAESFYGYSLTGPFGTAIMADPTHWVHRLPGGLLHNNIDHLLNKIVELSSDRWVLEHAHLGRRRGERYGDDRDRTPDELRLILRAGDLTAYGTFSAHIRPAGHFCTVYGSKNTVHLDFTTRSCTLVPSVTLPSAIGRIVPAFDHAARFARAGLDNVAAFARSEYQFFAGLERLIDLFYDSIEDGASPPIPYADIRTIARLMDDIFARIEAP